ncbi:hypothetical protein Ari01nite_36800 [Paractinoplanes rishiriensis]|uniref:Uncharacterized protein n=1 Tax=Paractinoplanes rishiriensis TaxID=1050105 RepID=A0A919MXV9_9ACTN|nr:hypothetical protein Ari01nite_36800 [Actinoplanes rishiriensis]
MTAPGRTRFARARATAIGVFMVALCLMLAGATSSPALHSPALLIEGMREISSPPEGTSWTPAPVDANGLTTVASADGQQFVLHTAAGHRTFLPGVNLGGTTPGHLPVELAISAAQYRAWFAAMSWLGIRVVRIYTIHPPAFYQQLAAFNEANPDRPLYLVQGVGLFDDAYRTTGNLYDKRVTDPFKQQLKDASAAVAGDLDRTPTPGQPAGSWDADVTPWLAGWIVGDELDPHAAAESDRRNDDAPAVTGKYFRSAGGATPTERWLAARMNELAELQAARRLSQPIAFVNWPTTDPLRHPDEPLEQDDLLQLDANHVQPTADWPAGTFASYHAYPYYPDFQRHEPALQRHQYGGRVDPYAGYLAALRKHHAAMPTLITEFGVPSSIGSAHSGPLGRNQGGHTEQDAMRIDAELMRLIKKEGLAGGFLFAWADEWYRYTWNTADHQVPDRRHLWHDPLTNEQYFGLLAMDPPDRPDADSQTLIDAEGGWPARRVEARTDESFLHLQIRLGGSPPGSLQLGFDVLPGLSGTPMAGSSDRRPDAVLALNLVGQTGQAYLRDQLDPLALDPVVPADQRGPAPQGWRAFELIVNRELTIPSTGQQLPIEMQNAGLLRYGDWRLDSRALWHAEGDELTVRVPWALLGFADPSAHRVGRPRSGKLTTEVSPGVSVTLSASGTDQSVGRVTWADWNRPRYTERLKRGAEQFRDAVVAVTSD